MNVRSLTLLSLTVSLALAGWLLRPAPPRTAPPVTTRPAATPAAPTPTLDLAAEPPREPHIVTRIAAFHWEQLEPQELFRFRDHLREIGCPENTLRTILESVVHRLYADRVSDVVRPYRGHFWDLVAGYLNDEKALEKELKGAVDAIEKLKDDEEQLLKELRGTGDGDGPAYTFDENQRALVDFLPADKQDQFVATETRMLELLRERQAAGSWSPEKHQAWAKERNEALQALMSPDEWFEYRLRSSGYTQVRDLRGVELTEDEVRSLAAIRLQVDDAREAVGKQQGKPASQTDPMADQIQSAEHALLGDERFAQLRLARSGQYQQAARYAERLGWAPDTTAAVADIARVAGEQEVRTRDDQTLDPAGREERLTVLRQETERALRAAVPAGSFENYERLAESWWTKMGK